MIMTILPVTYLGPVDWFSCLVRGAVGGGVGGVIGGGCIIDVGENWVKQTVRNRCEIMTSGGVASLVVPVHASPVAEPAIGGKTATKDVRIDNSKRWQHVHWNTLVSAYRGSPFFEHYEDRFAPIYERRFEFLIDLNFSLLEILLEALGLGELKSCGGLIVARKWVAAGEGDLDLRGKKALRRSLSSLSTPADSYSSDTAVTPTSNRRITTEYTQVFTDRLPFAGGLSIVDLLFCEGPAASTLLRSSSLFSSR